MRDVVSLLVELRALGVVLTLHLIQLALQQVDICVRLVEAALQPPVLSHGLFKTLQRLFCGGLILLLVQQPVKLKSVSVCRKTVHS